MTADQVAKWKAAIAAHNRSKRNQRGKRPPKPITGYRIPTPKENNMTTTTDTTWRELFPNGRSIYYEGDQPEQFRQQILDEFGFDVASPEHRAHYTDTGDPRPNDTWPEWIPWNDGIPRDEDGFWSYSFHCPEEYLDAIYGSDRFPMGS